MLSLAAVHNGLLKMTWPLQQRTVSFLHMTQQKKTWRGSKFSSVFQSHANKVCNYLSPVYLQLYSTLAASNICHCFWLEQSCQSALALCWPREPAVSHTTSRGSTVTLQIQYANSPLELKFKTRRPNTRIYQGFRLMLRCTHTPSLPEIHTGRPARRNKMRQNVI